MTDDEGYADGTPQIFELTKHMQFPLLTKNADFEEEKTTKAGKSIEQVIPPEWLVLGILGARSWPGIRNLNGVIEWPVLRRDGSVLDEPGYDSRTCVLFKPNCDFPEIKANPTKEDAAAGKNFIMKMIKEFPFVDDINRASCLAALISTVAQYMVAGKMPCFCFEARTPGAGKGLLINLMAIMHTGLVLGSTSYMYDNDEMRKIILAAAMSGEILIHFDDIGEPFGGSNLQAAMTTNVWKGRPLHTSNWITVPLNASFYASENIVTIVGDMHRRILPCRIEPMTDRPELTEFEIEDLEAYARENRGRLMHAAIAFLRAYIVAGKPGKSVRWGSFQTWSDLVANAVHWQTGINPIEAREGLENSDQKREFGALLVEAWDKLPTSRQAQSAKTVLKIVADRPGEFEDLEEVLRSMERDGGLPKADMLGKNLGSIKGRVFAGKRIVIAGSEPNGLKLWKVEVVSASLIDRSLPPEKLTRLAEWTVGRLLHHMHGDQIWPRLGDLIQEAGDSFLLDAGPEWDISWATVFRKAKTIIIGRDEPLPIELRNYELKVLPTDDGLESAELWSIEEHTRDYKSLIFKASG